MIHTFFDFCSGIGAGRLGLEQCGLVCVGRSDTSKLSDTTYMLLHDTKDETNYGNIRRLSGDKLPKFDVMIAGFPCQTFSVVGRREGFNDDRGQIIFHLTRLLRECKPKCFILENVKGLVSHDNGRTLKKMLDEITSSGFSVTYKVISSLDCGVPQMRQRIYMIGFSNELELDINQFPWPDKVLVPSLQSYLIDDGNEINEIDHYYFSKYLVNSTNVDKAYSESAFLKEEYLILDTRMNDMRIYRGKVPTLRSQRDGIFYVRDGKLRALSGYEALLLQGFPVSYASRVKDKVSNRHLLMQAGNAMTVNVIRLLGEAIQSFISNSKREETTKMANLRGVEFEDECFNYLVRNYGNYAQFFPEGGANSYVSDIRVLSSARVRFYIEVKDKDAQCGQFVLLPKLNNRQYIYSERNETPRFPSTDRFLRYANEHFEDFINAGNAGIALDIDKSICYEWVMDYYRSKQARFFMTKGHEYIIFPINRFPTYFDIIPMFRTKKSGSAVPPISRHRLIENLFANAGIVGQYYVEDNHFYIKPSNNATSYNGRKIKSVDYTYMLSLHAPNTYEIRQLSNTNNGNVIFKIQLKQYTQIQSDLSEFVKSL